MKRRPSAFAAAPVVPEPPRRLADVARAEEGVENHIARIRGGKDDAPEQSLRLLRGMGLAAALILQALFARADREEPIRARLRVVIAGLQRLVMEGIALGLRRARRPDQRFMGIGKAPAAPTRKMLW